MIPLEEECFYFSFQLTDNFKEVTEKSPCNKIILTGTGFGEDSLLLVSRLFRAGTTRGQPLYLFACREQPPVFWLVAETERLIFLQKRRHIKGEVLCVRDCFLY